MNVQDLIMLLETGQIKPEEFEEALDYPFGKGVIEPYDVWREDQLLSENDPITGVILERNLEE